MIVLRDSFVNKYDYIFQQINVHTNKSTNLSNIKIAVASIEIDENNCIKAIENPWEALTIPYKKSLNKVMKEAYDTYDNKVDLLVFPECTLPLNWLNDMVVFSKKTQIAVISGMQYITSGSRLYNYMLYIIPFENHGFKSVIVFLREKNDYSPIEIAAIPQKYKCVDAIKPEYQLFKWKNISIGGMLCFEFTDILARSLYKGKTDILVIPEFNHDTTYFSSIIESSVRDIYSVIVQVNTAQHGDSRIIYPCDHYHRDIIRIKGGDNSYTVIGKVDLKSLKAQKILRPKDNRHKMSKPPARFKKQ